MEYKENQVHFLQDSNQNSRQAQLYINNNHDLAANKNIIPNSALTNDYIKNLYNEIPQSGVKNPHSIPLTYKNANHEYPENNHNLMNGSNVKNNIGITETQINSDIHYVNISNNKNFQKVNFKVGGTNNIFDGSSGISNYFAGNSNTQYVYPYSNLQCNSSQQGNSIKDNYSNYNITANNLIKASEPAPSTCSTTNNFLNKNAALDSKVTNQVLLGHYGSREQSNIVNTTNLGFNSIKVVSSLQSYNNSNYDLNVSSNINPYLNKHNNINFNDSNKSFNNMFNNNINVDKAISTKPDALYGSELKKEKNNVVSSNQITHVNYQYNGNFNNIYNHNNYREVLTNKDFINLNLNSYLGEVKTQNDDRKIHTPPDDYLSKPVEAASSQENIIGTGNHYYFINNNLDVRINGIIPVNKKETMPEQKTRRTLKLLNLNEYEIGKTLGKGAFGRVKIARNLKTGNTIAIKSLKKENILKSKQEDHLHNEINILNILDHHFCANLVGVAQDQRYIYIGLELIQGGDLFSYLREKKYFNLDDARFYIAHIVLILEYLHTQNIIYRDLKPENILIDCFGYLKLTDMGLSKIIDGRTYTFCGTPEYMAPEILKSVGYGKSCDYWSLGILLYEFLAGFDPFGHDCGGDNMKMFDNILHAKLIFPKDFNEEAKYLIKHLCERDLSKRYGNLKNGVNDIKIHRFFYGFNFDDLLKRRILAPYVPKIRDSYDTSNFLAYPDSILQPEPVRAEEDIFATWFV